MYFFSLLLSKTYMFNMNHMHFTYFHCQASIHLHGNRPHLFSNAAPDLMQWAQTLVLQPLQNKYLWPGRLGWTVDPVLRPMTQRTLQHRKVDSVQDREQKSSMKKKD